MNEPPQRRTDPMQNPSLVEIEAAAAVIRPIVPPTPQYAWPLLAARAGCEVWVKHENHTPIGAFKVRGGLYYLHRLRAERRPVNGLVTATRGNHGQSLALAGRAYGVPVTVVVPHGNSVEKNAAMRALGAELIEYGEDFDAAREHAVSLAADRKLEMVPSFHRDLVCGVATYALEFFRHTPPLDTMYVPLGLGSGICGTLAVRDAMRLKTEVVGVVASGAPAYAQSFVRGHVVTTAAAVTFADGVACRVPDAEALALIKRGAARIVELTEPEIEHAIRAYYTDTHQLTEGAGAIALAALLKERERQRGKRVGVVLSGGNIDTEVFARVLSKA